MKCPYCRKPSKVLDVRERRREAKTRSRLCNNGHRFISYEITEERLAELLDFERAYEKMQTVVKEFAR